MPNPRLIAALLIAALVLLGIGLTFYLAGNDGLEGDENIPPTRSTTTPLIAADLRPHLQSVTIRHNPSGRVAQFMRDGTTWQQAAPQTQPADADRFVNPLNYLLSQPSRRILSPVSPSDLALYGLDQPRFTLHLQFSPPQSQPITRTLQVGHSTPTDDGFYIRLNDENQVHLIYQTGLLDLLLWVRE